MVTTASRKARARSAPAAEPEESVTMPDPEPQPELTTLREVYDSLVDRTRLRAEIINGRLIVSPLGTPEHQRAVTRLAATLLAHVLGKDWEAYAGLDICLDGSRDPYAPDLVIAPTDAPRWGNREVFASGVLMVGEVVSAGSARQDRDDKPAIYAAARIPVYLLIDALAGPPSVTVYAEPKDGAYTVSSTVAIGKELHIPSPIDFTLDTAIFL